jgi:hypothetical protein
MTRKKMEGNEQQRRKKAREARKRGRAPSQEAATTGASKQRHHLPEHDDHVEKIDTIGEGKPPMPGMDVSTPETRPRSRRWHRDHEHDPQTHPHPPEHETHGGKMP